MWHSRFKNEQHGLAPSGVSVGQWWTVRKSGPTAEFQSFLQTDIFFISCIIYNITYILCFKKEYFYVHGTFVCHTTQYKMLSKNMSVKGKATWKVHTSLILSPVILEIQMNLDSQGKNQSYSQQRKKVINHYWLLPSSSIYNSRIIHWKIIKSKKVLSVSVYRMEIKYNGI